MQTGLSDAPIAGADLGKAIISAAEPGAINGDVE
jgi:hypothetical protein